MFNHRIKHVKVCVPTQLLHTVDKHHGPCDVIVAVVEFTFTYVCASVL